MCKLLIVVDMQNDFVSGVLGTPEARAIVPNVVDKIRAGDYDRLIFTYDSHDGNYLKTREGRHLPISHCRFEGAFIIEEITDVIDDKMPWKKQKEGYDILPKGNFALENNIWERIIRILNDYLDISVPLDYKGENLNFEFVGLCTDICVISNVFAIRQAFPEAEITVDASCCAGTTPENHKAALRVMKSCQIDIINENMEMEVETNECD